MIGSETLIAALVTVNLGVSVVNARRLGKDPVARHLGRSAHSRIDNYVATDGGQEGDRAA